MPTEELSGTGRWPCKRGPEFGHLEPIKTRHTVQVSVIPARVPQGRRWKQNCKLSGQLTWHTPRKKQQGDQVSKRMARRADTEAVLWALQRNHATHEWVCAHTLIYEVQFSLAEMWSFFISLSFWNIIFSFMITSYYFSNQKDCMYAAVRRSLEKTARERSQAQNGHGVQDSANIKCPEHRKSDTIPL